jgi:16S rRNA (cytosine967-C5)-methyltransferase
LLELQPALDSLLAIDVANDRLRKVQENLERLQLTAALRNADAATPEKWWDGTLFDRILLDVPCSATGVIRRHPDIKLLRRASDIPDLARRQGEMLRRVWPLLARGGRLLYASCSALRAETSDVIAPFLTETGDADDITADACGEAGLSAPVVDSSGSAPRPGLSIPAGDAQMDGFYYACLGKR